MKLYLNQVIQFESLTYLQLNFIISIFSSLIQIHKRAYWKHNQNMVPKPMKLCDHNKTNKRTNNYGIPRTRRVSYWPCGEESFKLITTHSFCHKCHQCNLESTFFVQRSFAGLMSLVNEAYVLGIIYQIFQILLFQIGMITSNTNTLYIQYSVLFLSLPLLCFFFNFLAIPLGMQDLSFLTRD